MGGTEPRRVLEHDNNEATWEEMEMTISDDSNASLNTLFTMATAGTLEAIGLITNALHTVIAGMLVAAGFMPLLRISLGVIGRRRLWRYGLEDVIKGYGALFLGASATAAVMKLAGYTSGDQSAGYYVVAKPFVDYWTSFTVPSLLTSVAAAVAGTLLVATRRSVLTSGVMVGLALIPSAGIASVAAVGGNWDLLTQALLRLAADIAIVIAVSAALFTCDRQFLHKRDIKI